MFSSESNHALRITFNTLDKNDTVNANKDGVTRNKNKYIGPERE